MFSPAEPKRCCPDHFSCPSNPQFREPRFEKARAGSPSLPTYMKPYTVSFVAPQLIVLQVGFPEFCTR
jgi:hypothetical protein